MRTLAKTLYYACVLSMTTSCSSTSSSTLDDMSEIIDSIRVYQIDDKVKALDVYDMGNFLSGKEVTYATVICNFDSVRGVRIVDIDGDNIVSKCNPSLDSIEPGMLVSIDFKLKVPEKKGPFDASMRVYYKNVKNPSIFKLHGYAE